MGVALCSLASPPSPTLPQRKGVHARLRRAMGGGSGEVLPSSHRREHRRVHAASHLADRPVRLGRGPRAESRVRPAPCRAVGGVSRCVASDRVRQRRAPRRARVPDQFRAEARARHRAAVARWQSQAAVRRRPEHDGRDEAPHLHRRHGAAQRAGETHRRMEIAAAGRRRRDVDRCAQDHRRGDQRDGAGCDRACANSDAAEVVKRACLHPRRLRHPGQDHDHHARGRARRPWRRHRAARRRTRRDRSGRAGHPHALQSRRRPHAAAVRNHRRPPRRSAAGLCGGAQLQLLGGGLRLPLERAAAGGLAGGAAARQRALGHQARRTVGAAFEDPRGRHALPPASGDARRAQSVPSACRSMRRRPRASNPARSMPCAPASPTAAISTPFSPRWSPCATMAPRCCGDPVLRSARTPT